MGRTVQYWRPGGNQFVGDCMPFANNGVFHLFYLLDEGHHRALGGLGGHQWAHASTRDLRKWDHHPLALAIDAPWEGSICTGSVFFHRGVYHAFYATRLPDLTQHLGHAVSRDGVRFTKLEPRRFFSPPHGFSAVDCRDPFCFAGPDGRFHLAVTAHRDDPALGPTGGCLLHLVSGDLYAWAREPEPFLAPGRADLPEGVPECPDVFEWRGTHYLLCGIGLATHCLTGETAVGPWRAAGVPVLDSPTLSVIKTAPFGSGRRLAAGWLGSRARGGGLHWGGDLVMRELVLLPDRSLGTAFVPELAPPSVPAPPPAAMPLDAGAETSGHDLLLRGRGLRSGALLAGCPPQMHFRCTVTPLAGSPALTLSLGGSGAASSFAHLTLNARSKTATLLGAAASAVGGLDAPYTVEAFCTRGIVDVCIGGRRCLIHRRPRGCGELTAIRVEGGDVRLTGIEVRRVLR